jgi:hypothetical protein
MERYHDMRIDLAVAIASTDAEARQNGGGIP